MVKPTTRQSTGRTAFSASLLLAACVLAVSLFIGLGTAAGAGDDSETLGLGSNRLTIDTKSHTFDAASKLGVSFEDSAGVVEGLTQATKRSIVVKDPDPVVELAAVDIEDRNTMLLASKIGMVNPPATAPRLKVDTSGDEWLVGMASGYNVATSSTLSRSGREFNDNCITVAVPEGQEDLLGRAIEIVYEDQVIIATVTDTGGFAKYGRVLDLGEGVVKGFGAEDVVDWGVREVHYRFL